MTLTHDRGRPVREAASNVNVADGDTFSMPADRPRCQHCGHPIWAPDSVAVGVGKDCRRASREVIA